MDYKFKTIYYQKMQKEMFSQTLNEIQSEHGKPVPTKEKMMILFIISFSTLNVVYVSKYACNKNNRENN